MARGYSQPEFLKFVDVAKNTFTMLALEPGRKISRETALSIASLHAAEVKAAQELARVPFYAQPRHMRELYDALTNNGVGDTPAARLTVSLEGLRQASGRRITSPLLDRHAPDLEVEPGLHRWWNDLFSSSVGKTATQEMAFGVKPFAMDSLAG